MCSTAINIPCVDNYSRKYLPKLNPPFSPHESVMFQTGDTATQTEAGDNTAERKRDESQALR